LTIGDGDYKSIRLTSKKEGDIIKNSKEIITSIKKEEEIKLTVETILKKESILLSGFIFYTPENKPKEILTKDINIELPYEFRNDKFDLYIGLRGSEDSETKIYLTDCSIREKKEFNF